MHSALPTIKLENFEGPFDLLLELARSREVDLTVVSLAELTDSFLEYIQTESIPAETQADFLVVASTLLLLKVHHLLPTLTPEEEHEAHDLTDRLRIYMLYRQQALRLRRLWGKRSLLPGPERLVVYHDVSFPALNPSQLGEAMQRVIDQVAVVLPPTRALRVVGRSLGECVQLLRQRLERLPQLVFQREISQYPRQDQALSFLAVLELARQRRVVLTQEEHLGELHVMRHE